MDFRWPSKKDPRKDEPLIAAGEASGGEAQSDAPACLPEQLGQLECMLRDANQQVTAFLLNRANHDSSLLEALTEKIEALAKRIESAPIHAPEKSAATSSDTFILPLFEGIARKLDMLEAALKSQTAPAAASGGPSPEAMNELVGHIRAALYHQEQSLGGAFHQLAAHVDGGLQQIAELVRPAEPPVQEEVEAAPPAGSAEWLRAILGPALAGNAAIAAQCRQLIDGVIDGAAAACGFAGQLLVFQSATPEKMPTLLKDIGESFYRWHPKTRPGEGKFEEALVHWLQNACDDAGIPNRIEVVSTGERFDAGRHNTNGRGVEINEVLGWVVVRDNGKVYTKALVGVK